MDPLRTEHSRGPVFPGAGRSAGAIACAESGDRLGDPCGAGLGFLGLVDPAHPLLTVGVGERFEEVPRRAVVRERVAEIGRHANLARGGVELDVDIHLLAGDDPAAARCSALSGTTNRPPIDATVVR